MSYQEHGPLSFQACRYSGEWEKTVRRIGRWIDFGTGYKTMDASFMESVWWVFKQLWDKGLVYQGHKVRFSFMQFVSPPWLQASVACRRLWWALASASVALVLATAAACLTSF